jgi:hypothetical protein
MKVGRSTAPAGREPISHPRARAAAAAARFALVCSESYSSMIELRSAL